MKKPTKIDRERAEKERQRKGWLKALDEIDKVATTVTFRAMVKRLKKKVEKL